MSRPVHLVGKPGQTACGFPEQRIHDVTDNRELATCKFCRPELSKRAKRPPPPDWKALAGDLVNALEWLLNAALEPRDDGGDFDDACQNARRLLHERAKYDERCAAKAREAGVGR